MSTLNSVSSINVSNVFVSLEEAATAIMVYGQSITPVLVSEPGVGKSSMLAAIAAKNGDKWRKRGDYFPEDKYCYIYIDWSQTDLADLFMSGPDKETGKLKRYMTELLMTDDPRPHIVMIDEYTKPMSKLMEAASAAFVLDKTLPGWTAPAGSIFFATSNNASDGVGDKIMAHCGNRVTFFYVLKPDNRAWARWAMNNGISQTLVGWSIVNPDKFESYKTCSEESLRNNASIFIPGKSGATFGSPRSYAKCDVIIKNMHICGEHLTHAALAGTVGMAAAESMMAFIALGKELPTFEEIKQDPNGTRVPNKFAAQIVSITKTMLGNIKTQDDLSACAAYVSRFESNEAIALFHCLLSKTPDLQKLASQNAQHNQWMMTNKNYELLK